MDRTEVQSDQQGVAAFYKDLADYIADSDIRIGASVYDSVYGFAPGEPTWVAQAKMSAKLVVGNTNKEGEAVNIFLDLVQTPRGESVSEVVKGMARARLGSPCIIEAYDLDLRSTDGLQVADFVASAIAFERQYGRDRTNPKAAAARRLRRALDLPSFDDVRSGKANILTMRNAPELRNHSPFLPGSPPQGV